MKNIEKDNSKKAKKDKKINFSIAFKEDGDSFQNIMEKILLNKMTKNM